MKPVKFTDSFRYPFGYTKADRTDVRLTFAREFERLKAAAKVVPINRKEKTHG